MQYAPIPSCLNLRPIHDPRSSAIGLRYCGRAAASSPTPRSERQKGPVGYGAEEAAAFCATVRREAEKVSGTTGCDPDDLAGLAERYAERRRSYSFHAPDEIYALFADAGFAMDAFDVVDVKGDGAAGRSGPGSNRNGQYVEIVAVRE